MTRKEYAAKAPDYFWHLMPDGWAGTKGDAMHLAVAQVDEGQLGYADSFDAVGKDGSTVKMLSPFPLTNDEKQTVRDAYKQAGPRWITGWAKIISPKGFTDGLELNDYARGVA